MPAAILSTIPRSVRAAPCSNRQHGLPIPIDAAGEHRARPAQRGQRDLAETGTGATADGGAGFGGMHAEFARPGQQSPGNGGFGT
jgi:hypothetical protein